MNNSFDQVQQAIQTLNPRITAQEWDYFQLGLTQHTLVPKTFLIEAGKPNQLIGFLTKGLIRDYYLNQTGEEITTIFVLSLTGSPTILPY